MKNIKYIKRYAILFLSVLLVSCTGTFDDLNTDVTGVKSAKSDGGGDDGGDDGGATPYTSLLTGMMRNVYTANPIWREQIKSNLASDAWAGYLAPPTPFIGNVNNTTYSLVDGWNGFSFAPAYDTSMKNYGEINKASGASSLAKGIALALRVSAMAVVTDKFGPIIYTKFGTVDKNTPYDSQKDVYTAFFADLDTAMTNIDADDAESGLSDADIIYAADATKWKAYVNTLRLRLAIRIAKVDPTKAKTEGEKALASPAGFITEQAKFPTITAEHPLYRYNHVWNDSRMAADMESFLVGYKDPRLPKYFNPVSDDPDLTKGAYIGIRSGARLSAKADYTPYSTMNIAKDAPIVLMHVAESHFLKAEAALRGWTGAGSADANYQAGIEASFIEKGLTAAQAATYMASSATPSDYTDPKEPKNNIAAKTKVTPKWSDATTPEMQLEKIITQKWLAIFPNGEEAWSEYRRTGYPNIFQVYRNTGVTTIPTQIDVAYGPGKVNGIRRINFTLNQRQTNEGEVAKAKTLLSAEASYGSKDDDGSTSVWWDVNTSNL